MMDDLISRQAVIDCYKKWQPYMSTKLLNFEKELYCIPSVQPKTGYWIKKITRKEPTCEVWHFECSECGEWEYRADFEHGKFCSNCGTKMEGVAE